MCQVKRIYHFISSSKILIYSASLSFFIILNGGSFIFLLVNLFSFIKGYLIDIINTYLITNKAKELLIYLINHNSNIGYSIFLVLTSIYSSSSLYYNFINIINLLTNNISHNNINKRIKAILITPLTMLIIIIFVLILVFVNMLNIKYISFISNILIIIYTLTIIYFFNYIALGTYNLKSIYKGVIFTFLYFIIFTYLFIVYLKLFSNFKIVYGILSFLVILMFYVYNISISLLFGIYINCKKLEVFKIMLSKK